MLDMKTLVYNPAKGYDVLVTAYQLNYEPGKYTTKEDAAKGLYEELRRVARLEGQSPDSEVVLESPQESEARGYGKNWRVVWEAGPFEWATNLSFSVTGPWGFTEPYYSFDLCFTE